MIESEGLKCCCPLCWARLSLQLWLCLSRFLPGSIRAGQGSLTVHLYSHQSFALMGTETAHLVPHGPLQPWKPSMDVGEVRGRRWASLSIPALQAGSRAEGRFQLCNEAQSSSSGYREGQSQVPRAVISQEQLSVMELQTSKLSGLFGAVILSPLKQSLTAFLICILLSLNKNLDLFLPLFSDICLLCLGKITH